MLLNPGLLLAPVDPRLLHQRLATQRMALHLQGDKHTHQACHKGSEQRSNAQGAHRPSGLGVQRYTHGGQGELSLPLNALRRGIGLLTALFPLAQFSQMRDEMFNSNLVCSFIMLLFLMAAQALIPAPRYNPAPPPPGLVSPPSLLISSSLVLPSGRSRSSSSS